MLLVDRDDDAPLPVGGGLTFDDKCAVGGRAQDLDRQAPVDRGERVGIGDLLQHGENLRGAQGGLGERPQLAADLELDDVTIGQNQRRGVVRRHCRQQLVQLRHQALSRTCVTAFRFTSVVF